MAQRNFFFPSNTSEMDHDQVRNGFNSDSRLPLENGSFAFPVDNLAINRINPVSYPSVPLRSNDYASSSTGIPHYRPVTSGTSDLHQQQLSTASSSSFVPSSYAHLGPCYNHCIIPSDEGRNPNPPPMDEGRVLAKRKSPSVAMFNDPGNTNRYYNGGNSAGIASAADQLQQKHFPSSQQWHWDPNIAVHNYSGSSSLLVPGEGSHGNVRSRHPHVPHLDGNQAGAPCHFPPAGDLPGLAANPRWCHNLASHGSFGRPPPPGGAASWFGHVNQSYLVSSTADVSAEPSGSRRHVGAPAPPAIAHAPQSAAGEGQHSSRQRSGGPSHRPTPCYPNSSFTAAASEEVRHAGSGAAAAFTRHPRSLSISGGAAPRGADPLRPFNFSSFLFLLIRHPNYVLSQEDSTADRSAYYDSVNLFDQHRDLRLDVDNMSYERIGSVNTGLSEDTITKCLKRTVYSPAGDQAQDLQVGSCVICLERYEDEDELGTLGCGHDYHADCVRSGC
ncbi:unnamed protein product [Spirodela intermedia]|uniref:RING-type E3 ubiquitin transferase n=1 Tax=Spirodela intermedia TaxID=51605 RepID=A0A7I8IB11_SPIIN|nr:unnamed protein product [Spirodela intermedia]CAA6654770.1 unnamed protein product [Spirodela intermedia]